MDRAQLEKILPHREPMLLLDKVVVKEDNQVLGYYHARGDEFFFQGHFPGKPVIPGVILCEIMAQTSCGHFQGSLKNKIPLLIGIKDCKIRRSVVPGENVEVESYLLSGKGIFKETRCIAKVNDAICAEGILTFYIQ